MNYAPVCVKDPSQAEDFREWFADVIEIKQLFASRKYRYCATRCKELRKSAVHPVHTVFLYLYQALCYESLGAAVHVYSNNKLPFLQSAEECLVGALQFLPDPAAITEDGKTSVSQSPSVGKVSDVSQLHTTPQRHLRTPLREISGNINRREDFSSPSSVYSIKNQIDRTPDFNAYTPRRDWTKDLSSPDSVDNKSNLRVANYTPQSGHKKRLSQSLSSNHVLANELVPSPLFKKTRPHAKSTAQSPETSSELQLQSASRPLPPLPFNHKPNFQKRGSRHVLVPTQRTTVQKLASKFEDQTQTAATPSPFTPRFRFISTTFSQRPTTDLHQHDVSTDTPITTASSSDSSSHNPSPPSPQTLPNTPYETCLISLKLQLQIHQKSIKTQIDTVTETQRQRERHSNHHRQLYQDTNIPSSSSSYSSNLLHTSPNRRKATTEQEKMRKRIDELKTRGWDVKKEKFGWKGREFYDGFVRDVEMDLSGEVGGSVLLDE